MNNSNVNMELLMECLIECGIQEWQEYDKAYKMYERLVDKQVIIPSVEACISCKHYVGTTSGGNNVCSVHILYIEDLMVCRGFNSE